MATTAPLLAQYAKRLLTPTRPATDPIFTTVPFDASKLGRAACVTRQVPSTFTRNTRSKSAAAVSSMLPIRPMPAQLTRMSRAAIGPRAACTAASSRISKIRTAEQGTCAASASARTRSTSAMVTAAPAAASVRQVASPIPLAPPVTRAVRPSSRKGGRKGVFILTAARAFISISRPLVQSADGDADERTSYVRQGTEGREGREGRQAREGAEAGQG